MSDAARRIIDAQKAKGRRIYGPPLHKAPLTPGASGLLTAQELADLVGLSDDPGYLLDFVRRHIGVLSDDDADFLTLHALDAEDALNIVARYADEPEELPPLVPTREAVERHGHYWYRGEHVARVVMSIRTDDAPWDYDSGEPIDPTDDWRGPVPRAPRGAR